MLKCNWAVLSNNNLRLFNIALGFPQRHGKQGITEGVNPDSWLVSYRGERRRGVSYAAGLFRLRTPLGPCLAPRSKMALWCDEEYNVSMVQTPPIFAKNEGSASFLIKKTFLAANWDCWSLLSCCPSLPCCSIPFPWAATGASTEQEGFRYRRNAATTAHGGC